MNIDYRNLLSFVRAFVSVSKVWQGCNVCDANVNLY